MSFSVEWFERMLKRMAVVMLVVALLGLISPPRTFAQDTNVVYLPLIMRAEPINTNPEHEGIATYYYATGAGACSFDKSPDDLMVAAMNADEYDQAAYCGAYILVTGRKGSVVVRVVDLCPGCSAGHLDLSVEAFEKIDNLSAGRVPISWQVISPALGSPISYHFKSGSSRWWTAVQVRNHRNPIDSFEYRTTGSSDWVEVPRYAYNYFVRYTGMGPGPYDFRVTDWYGNVLTDSAIPLVENGTIEGEGQFPVGP